MRLSKPAVGFVLFQASIVGCVGMCSTLPGYERTNVAGLLEPTPTSFSCDNARKGSKPHFRHTERGEFFYPISERDAVER
ncbi:MAG: hypothetical protein ACREXY_17245, partial [Gammaproteobacteria bacterium]